MGCTDSKPEAVSQVKVSPVKVAGLAAAAAAGGRKDKGAVQVEGTAGAAQGMLLNSVLEKAGDVRAAYTFSKVLGKGNFGVVHLVYDKQTQAPYACKSISKRKLTTLADIEDVRREIQILLHLAGHKNVVQMYGAYEDKAYIHMVMECCAGGELFTRIADKGHFTERTAAEYMRTIVSVVHHCHTMNVIHRDLKPENFLLSTKGPDAVLKATDFGLSRFFKEGQLLDEIVGSPYYVAPEVLQRRYGQEADIWSCGVILYILLCGFPPFHGENAQQIFKAIMSKPLDLRTQPWPNISDAAKDCVKQMLSRNPSMRLTASQVLEHPWMKVNGVAQEVAVMPEVLNRLRAFGKMNFLKKEALKVIARNLPAQELQGMKEMFKAIDEDDSGCITVDELREGLRKKGAELALSEVEKIVNQIDINGNSLIDYEEFIAATIHLNKLEREDIMVEAFKFFDRDNSGYITHEELMTALQEVESVSAEEVSSILHAADKNGDGKIDYEEFCVMMRNNDFEAIVQAKQALRSGILIAPDASITSKHLAVHEEEDAWQAAPTPHLAAGWRISTPGEP